MSNGHDEDNGLPKKKKKNYNILTLQTFSFLFI